MKRLVAVLLLLLPGYLLAAKPRAADYSVTIHVVFSRGGIFGEGAVQNVQAVIDGQQVELQSTKAFTGLLTPADYQAKAVHLLDENNPVDAVDVVLVYRLLLPDGKTRDFYVCGLGPRNSTASVTNP